MRLVQQLSVAAGLIVVAASALGAAPAQAHDGWKQRHKHHHRHHHHHHHVPPGHVRYYSAPPVIYERPVVYREAPLYYVPARPPSLNITIPLR
jgi:hypothetical protein